MPNFIDETRKIRDFDRFSLSELGFGMTIWKDPRQQSTKVEKLKIQCFSFTKHKKYRKSPSEQKVINDNILRFFLVKKIANPV